MILGLGSVMISIPLTATLYSSLAFNSSWRDSRGGTSCLCLCLDLPGDEQLLWVFVTFSMKWVNGFYVVVALYGKNW